MTAFKNRPWHPVDRQRWQDRQDELDRFVASNPDVHGCADEYGVGQPDFEDPRSLDDRPRKSVQKS